MGDSEESTNRKLVAGSGEKRSVREVLIAARDRIAKPGAWTQKAYARRANATITTTTDPHAVCWCVHGAINAEDGSIGEDDSDAKHAVSVAIGILSYSLVPWNDAPGRTQEEVIAAFDRAIAAQDGAL